MKIADKYYILLAEKDILLQEYIDAQIKHLLWSVRNQPKRITDSVINSYLRYILIYRTFPENQHYDPYFIQGWALLLLYKRCPDLGAYYYTKHLIRSYLGKDFLAVK